MGNFNQLKKGGNSMYSSSYEPGYDFLFGQISTIWMVIWFALAVFGIVCEWKMFEKAGEPGWAALIPFYDTYVMFKIAFGNGWLFLLLLVPIVNIYFAIAISFKLAKAYGQGTGFGFGLLLLGAIFEAIIAFDNSIEYVGANTNM